MLTNIERPNTRSSCHDQHAIMPNGVLRLAANYEGKQMKNLHEFAKDLWIVDGPVVRDMGAFFTTRMTIVKLSGGSICISSPVPVSFDTLREISELGSVRYLIAATPRHVWRLDLYHTLFPDAELWVSRPTLFTLQKGPLPISGYLGDTPNDAWKSDFDQLEFAGLSEVLFLHKVSHTVILDDLIQRNPVLKDKPWTNFLFKIEGVQYPHGGVPLDMKMAFLLKRRLFRHSLDKLLSWDFDKLIIAHGPCIESGAKQYIKKAFRWLEK
jgi:hypothetical protein